MQPKVTYSSTRLHFKAHEIEPLAWEEEFQVVTATGVWQMSKADFYKVFSNVVASESYSKGRREYHYTKPPTKSDRFRISADPSEVQSVYSLEEQLRQLESRIGSPYPG